MSERKSSLINFILSEKYINLTVLGSIFTFAFISSMKMDIVDPILHFVFPEEFFGFMNINIREGEKMVMPPRNLEIRFGNFFRELTTWLLLISILYFLAKYTRFPDLPQGNACGSAIP
jgi:large-conductance mechanosensitive channel